MMMSRFLLMLIFVFLGACQVKEEVATSNIAPQNFINPEFTVGLPATGWKKLGEAIDINLVFPYSVSVTGSPYINSLIGSSYKRFYYYSGSGSNSLFFRYTVTSSDFDDDGIQFVNSIVLNGGSVSYTGADSFVLPTPTALVMPPTIIKVDGVIPTISNKVLYATNRFINYFVGWKSNGDTIDISMVYPYSVIVAGSPYVTGFVGNNSKIFSYLSGSGTNTIIYRYTLTAADVNVDRLSLGPDVNLNGGNLSYFNSTTGTYDLAATSLNYTGVTVKVDGVVPSPYSITAPLNGNYVTNQYLRYIVDFSEKVYIKGTPGFLLGLGSGSVLASYYSGSGTSSLGFRWQITAGDIDGNGYSTNSSWNLNALAGIDITDEAGNSLTSTFPVVSSNIIVNVSGPTIASVTPPAASTYTVGQNLDFTVLMSEAVTVTGAPALPITLSTGPVTAKYISGTGTNTLIFRYTVIPNQQDLDDITLTSPMILSGGSIKNLALTKPAILTYTVPATAGVYVNSVTGPFVIQAFTPASGTYIEGLNLDYSLKFNTPITVVGNPYIELNLGAGTVQAIYDSSLSNNTTMVFRYTTLVSDYDADGITVASPIILPMGASIADATSALSASLIFTPADSSGVKVDGVAPTILSIAPPVVGNYLNGQNLYFSVTMSENVTVSGTPLLNLDLNGSPVTASYDSGSGSNVLIFKYTIQTGDIDTDGVGVNTPLNLNGGSIVDAQNHPLTALAFASFVANNVLVDAQVPTITSVTPPVANTYKVGDPVKFIVNFSESVLVTGTPRIQLLVGTATAYANYDPVGSTGTAKVFRYIVSAGQSDNDDISIPTLAVALNGGAIKDVSANNAALTFAAPVLTGVLVDGVAPTVASIIPPANDTYKPGDNLIFEVVWSEAVNVTGNPKLKLTIGTQDVWATYFSGLGTSTFFSYTVQANDIDSDGINLHTVIHLNSGTIKDVSVNDANLTFVSPSLINVKVDGIPPYILSLTPPPNETYQRDQYVYFQISWSEAMNIDTTLGSPRIKLLVGLATRYADFYPALSNVFVSTFRYKVLLNDLDLDGLEIIPIAPSIPSLDLNNSVIEDVAGNTSAITFNRPILTGVKIDGVTPYITSVTSTAGTYNETDDVFFTTNWSENMLVDTTLGTPTLTVLVGGVSKTATYDSVVGSTIIFKYTVAVGDEDLVSTVKVQGSISLNGGVITDTAPNTANLALPTTTYSTVIVDGKAPVITSTGSWTGSAYYPGSAIWYQIAFQEPVVVTGSPYLILNIGGTVVNATYQGFAPGQGNKIIEFKYTIPAGNTQLDLNGIAVTGTIQSGGGIKDASGHPAGLTFTYTEIDYVYYSNILARYHVKGSDYSSATCTVGAPSVCVTGLTDISGKSKHISGMGNYAPILGPTAGIGYGGNSSMYMQLSKTPRRYIPLPYLTSVKYFFIANKSQSFSTASPMLKNATTTIVSAYNGGFGFNSSYPMAMVKQNASTATGLYSASYFIGRTTNTEYINGFGTGTYWAYNLTSGTIGSPNGADTTSAFDGQVAEMLFFSNASTLTAAQLTAIQDQLNAIHDVYP